ncbi:hypothetical protein C475_01177 [Halosimplex carlsbadense 2-9-1]|uniref:DUF1616 domain-containing protein n=1 Tax=Halosimplex carlsbadense 2-9-1 TaxID=797114 RepID=M0D820_9EURY|nr:DUF1616 domain-containing protein [Halosimplex carlsbadense]ELZ30304.1 hypothetical protein C475_01177 [Halosimplex carlsbadense 2-9-1]
MGTDLREVKAAGKRPSGLPADLAGVVGLTSVVVAAAVLPIVNETLVRALVAIPFALFAPGWALVAVLFPHGHHETDESGGDRTVSDGLTLYERVALSFGTSIAVIPVVGLVLDLSPVGLAPDAVVASLAGLVLALVAVAVRRRRALPSELRYSVPYRRWLSAARSNLFRTETSRDTALTAVVAVSLLLAVGSVGFVAVDPKQGAQFSEFYLLGADDSGDLTAESYPQNFTVGESRSLVVGIQNDEQTTTSYTVVVRLDRVELRASSTRVVESERLHRFEPRLAANETWHRQHAVRPSMAGERLRLTYLLYRESPPEDPTVGNAYRDARLWIDVNER